MSYKDTLQLWVILYFPVLRVIIWRDHSFGIKVILKNKKQSKQTNKKHLNYRRYRKKKSYLTKSECLEITAAINLVQKDFLWIQLPRTQTTHYINIKKKKPNKIFHTFHCCIKPFFPFSLKWYISLYFWLFRDIHDWILSPVHVHM